MFFSLLFISHFIFFVLVWLSYLCLVMSRIVFIVMYYFLAFNLHKVNLCNLGHQKQCWVLLWCMFSFNLKIVQHCVSCRNSFSCIWQKSSKTMKLALIYFCWLCAICCSGSKTSYTLLPLALSILVRWQ